MAPEILQPLQTEWSAQAAAAAVGRKPLFHDFTRAALSTCAAPKNQILISQLSSKVRSGERWAGREGNRKIQQVFANSMDFDFASIGKPQLIFIDGAHDEEAVASDTRNAMQIVDRGNGLVVWHDARDFGVRPVLRDLFQQGQPVAIIEHTNIAILRFRDGQPVNWFQRATHGAT